MNINLNKNISVWRGNNTPPTDYHLWIKDDGSILVKILNQAGQDEWVSKSGPSIDNTIKIPSITSLEEALQWLSTQDTITVQAGTIIKFQENGKWTEYISVDTNYQSPDNWEIIGQLNVTVELQEQIDALQIVQVEPTDNEILTSYLLQDKNNTVHGVTINIPKDKSIKDVQVLDTNATIDGEGNLQAGDPKGNTALCIVYIIADGSYKLAIIDYQLFIEETEYSDGLTVEEHKIKIQLDPDTEKYLTVSPTGLKLSGIDLLVDDAKKQATQALAAEALARQQADTLLQSNIDKEVSDRQAAIETVNEAISQEALTRQLADTLLQTNINNEAGSRLAADAQLLLNIKTEATNRTNADNNLQTNINNEAQTRAAADTALQSSINQEIQNRQSADEAINESITNLASRVTTAETDIDTNTAAIQEIKNTYLPLSGGTMTGDVIFGDDSNGYEYVDLGLPSGLLWAKCNIGATNEEEAGLYFQWGDTQGYTAEQVGDGEGLKAFSWNDYKWSVDGSSSNFSKYNASDSKTVLVPEDDAAHVNMGGNWRMPTFEEYKELCLNTDIYLVPTEGEEIQGTAQEQDGSIMINWASQVEGTLKGVKFYKKGDKQTYMFVPASGDAYDGSVQGVGEHGYLWTSSLHSSGVQRAWDFGFLAYYGDVSGSGRRGGYPVRGISSSLSSGSVKYKNKTSNDLIHAAGGTVSIEEVREGLVPVDNVLTKDNTTEFTPDADYEPATKKYVDDNVSELLKVNSNALVKNDGTVLTADEREGVFKQLSGKLELLYSGSITDQWEGDNSGDNPAYNYLLLGKSTESFDITGLIFTGRTSWGNMYSSGALVWFHAGCGTASDNVALYSGSFHAEALTNKNSTKTFVARIVTVTYNDETWLAIRFSPTMGQKIWIYGTVEAPGETSNRHWTNNIQLIKCDNDYTLPEISVVADKDNIFNVIGNASSTDDGLMSSEDKVKLDGLSDAAKIFITEDPETIYYKWFNENGGTVADINTFCRGDVNDLASAIQNNYLICYRRLNDVTGTYYVMPYEKIQDSSEADWIDITLYYEYDGRKHIRLLPGSDTPCNGFLHEQHSYNSTIINCSEIANCEIGADITQYILTDYPVLGVDEIDLYTAIKGYTDTEGTVGCRVLLKEVYVETEDDSYNEEYVYYMSKDSNVYDKFIKFRRNADNTAFILLDKGDVTYGAELSDTLPLQDASEANAGTSEETARADHVHPFAAGDIQNPKSMDGANMEQLITPGFYFGVPQNTSIGNPPAITDRAVLQISYMDNKSTRTVLQVLFPDGNSPYYRTNPGEVWTDWKPLSETDLTGTAVKPNTFASGDLDTLTQTGMYVLTSDILSDYTNFPPVPTGYTPYYPVLYVYNSGGVVSQTISVNHGDNKLYSYSRNNQPGAFGDWTGGVVGEGGYNTGCNTVTSLANIPVTKRLVIANISANATLSLSSGLPVGEIHIIVNNSATSNITITLPSDTTYKHLSGNTLTIASESTNEINIIYDGTNYYTRLA